MFIKKITSCVLLLIIFFYLLAIPISCSANNTNRISYNNVQKTINYAERQVLNGEYHHTGGALNYVATTWSKALPDISGWFTNTCCATGAKENFLKSTKSNKYNYPEGASIFFEGGPSNSCGKHSKDAGHMGIHVGGGYIIYRSTTGKIERNSIAEIVANGYTYVGWGYPSGKILETKPAVSNKTYEPPIQLQPENKEDSNLSINVEKLPTNVISGNSFGLHGEITSNYEIISITGTIYSHAMQKTLLSYTDKKVNTKSLDIATSILNTKLKFGNLPLGKYTLLLIAEDITGNSKCISREFTINPKPLSIKLTSNLDLTNNTHTAGKQLGLYGTISSSYNLSIIRGYIKDSKGRIIKKSEDNNIQAKSLNINKSNLNRYLTFSSLAPGNYNLVIYVKDSSGKTIILNKKFKVIENNTTVTGTVTNLQKLGWTTVTIREKASTKHKAIGYMTTGQKCTIHLNKSTKSWYYVEYNGIKGYASKKGISI